MKTIELDSGDDINSVRDRLEWQGARQTLLVMPAEGDVLEGRLDLVRLRRIADQLRLEVGLVTRDRAIARRAKGVGLPVFSSVEEGLSSRRGWWRGRRRREQVGVARVAGAEMPGSLGEPRATRSAPLRELDSPRRWLFRFGSILLFFLAGALLVILFSYFVPGATLTLKPEIIPVSATKLLQADPAISSVNLGASTIPARLVRVDQSWSDETKTTGSVVVPAAQARGKVVFVNRTESTVEIPAGTEVSDGEGERLFYTVAAVSMVGVVSSTAEVDVLARLPGPQGNVPESSLVRVIGNLSSLLDVSNPEPMFGGDVRQVAAVSEEDQSRLRAQVLQFLQALAMADMQAQLTEREFLPRDSMRVVQLYGETFSHGIGEQTAELRLKLEGILEGTAIDLTESTGLVYQALVEEIPSGFALAAEGISYRQGKILAVDETGRITFEVNGAGLLVAELDLSDTLERIEGQEPRFALAYLAERLPLREAPTLDTWPSWFKRVPYRSSRISSNIVTK
jgi:hypothetical protein